MDIFTATEQSYRNGYEAGVLQGASLFANLVKSKLESEGFELNVENLNELVSQVFSVLTKK